MLSLLLVSTMCILQTLRLSSQSREDTTRGSVRVGSKRLKTNARDTNFLSSCRHMDVIWFACDKRVY